MALTTQSTTPAGVPKGYHRVSKILVRGEVSSAVVESFPDQASRADPMAQPHRSTWDFVSGPPDVPAAVQAYQALLSSPWWAGAVPDVPTEPDADAAPAQPEGYATWVSGAWQARQTLDEARSSARAAIDRAAGSARLRYITDVPGQSETYQRKEAQAREWALSGFAGQAPSFIRAEAEALGVDERELAEEILEVAALWVNVKGPQIEALRRRGAADVASAETPPAVHAVRDAVIEALRKA